MGSTTMAFNKILVCAFLGAVAGQNTRTFPGFGNTFNNDIQPSTTPVPILKFIDQQNNDGSYTYGFQSADGTYKIETRLATGEVKGKYGYIDENGNLKETTYGAMTETGFLPVVDGIKYAVTADEDVNSNAIPVAPAPTQAPALIARATSAPLPAPQQAPNSNRGRFANFPGQNKIVNGRRAVLRKRLRARPEAEAPVQQQQVQPPVSVAEQEEPVLTREESLRARQEGLRALEQQRAALRKLQQEHISGRTQSARAFPGRFQTAQQQQRSFPQQQFRQQPQQFTAQQEQPRSQFVSGINLSTGTYTIQY